MRQRRAGFRPEGRPPIRTDGAGRRRTPRPIGRATQVLCAGAIALALAAVGATGALAQQGGAGLGPVTKLPMPRYVSLGSNEINVRRGPGLMYRKDWVFRRSGLPVRIVDEYGDWRRIVDSDDAGGWVYHALLSGRRTVLVTAAEAVLRDEPGQDAPMSARAEQGAVARLVECEPDWCEIEANDISGWVRKEAIWGVDPEETWPE